MNASSPDLDERLRRLAPPTGGSDASGIDDRIANVHARAAKRRDRRRTGLVIAALPVIAVLALVAASVIRDDGRVRVDTVPDPTVRATAPEGSGPDPDASQTIGNIEGVSITATPNRDLADGDQVQVRVKGLDKLESALMVQCAGNVTAENATRVCDLRMLDRVDVGPGEAGRLEAEMTVTVRSTITISGTDNGSGEAYDCATEPEGCVLAVGQQTSPIQGAFVPLYFRAQQPQQTPSMRIQPATGLQDHEQITVTATGLRPNSAYFLRQCTVADSHGCDELAWPTATTDADGTFTTGVFARAAVYGNRGRFDCTDEPCQIAISEDYATDLAHVPIAFAADVTPPTPKLSVDPAGPYTDGQAVTVTGTGFPPGADVGGHIAQCPDDKDTAVEERCSYSVISSTLVGDDGTFIMRVRIQESLIYGSCTDESGCHLGWILPHGPTIAKYPLEFAP